jgi:hypothetical protein
MTVVGFILFVSFCNFYFSLSESLIIISSFFSIGCLLVSHLQARKTMRAQELWFQIVNTQIETGMPYMLYKDACNKKSNQQHLGTIRSSNLCTEIIEYTSEDEIAVCNLV